MQCRSDFIQHMKISRLLRVETYSVNNNLDLQVKLKEREAQSCTLLRSAKHDSMRCERL